MRRHNKAVEAWILVGLSLLLLGISTWLATKKRLVLGEEHILRFAYGLPEDLRLIFLIITLLGSVWVLAVVLTVLLIKARFDIALRLILASSATYIIVGIAKEIVGRPRPGVLSQILQRELFVMGYGFPSAHTALATTIAIVLAAYLPKNRWVIVLVWVGLVALSRLYLGVHAPLDIIGGICIGILSAYSVLLVLPPHKNISKIRVAKSVRRA